MSPRICLITPGHVAFNPRIVKEADALSAAGYDVHVIAANNIPALRAFDRLVTKGAGWTFEPVGGTSRVVTFTRRLRGRLSRASGLLAAKNLIVAQWGHHPLTRLLATRAKAHRADLYIAHYIAAIPAAFEAAQRHASKWGFDAEDFHSGEFDVAEQHNVQAKIVDLIERRYLPSACYLTAASDGISEAYRERLVSLKPWVVLNVFPLSQAPREVEQARPAGPSIYWFSQTIGTNRGLECAIEAMSIARCRPHLYLRGQFQSGFEAVLDALARRFGVADRLHYLAPAPAAEMERLASAYDLGFVGETGHTLNRRIAVTNKLFSFLLAGIPVVASDIPAHRSFSSEHPALSLFEVGNPPSLAAAIDSVLLDPVFHARARSAAALAARSRYNWDMEKLKLIEAVQAQIGSP